MKGDTLNGSIHRHAWPATAQVAATAGQGVYLFHGLGEHAARYDHVAQWFAARGYKVAAHDHPSHGLSAGERGVLANDNVITDTAVEQYQRFARGCSQPPLLVGHSMGGAVAAHLVLTGRLKPSGLILSAPAFEPAIGKVQQVQLRLMKALAQDFTVTARLSGPKLTHDPAMTEAWATDRLITRKVSARLITWLLQLGAEASALAETLSTQTLLLIPEADEIVRPEASHAFARRAPAEMLTTCSYSGLYHELFNEELVARAKVFADVGQWLDRTIVKERA